MRLLLAALALSVFAGCVSPPAATLEPAALPLDDALAALEAGEPSANIHLVQEWRDGFTAESDAWGDWLIVDRANVIEILDVSGENLSVVASITPPASVEDVKISDDGRFLFVGDDTERSGLLGGTGPLKGGFYVIDIADPQSPKDVAYLPIGERRGPHMVFYHQYPDGREMVFGASADVTIAEFDRDAGTLDLVGRYSPDLVFGFNRDPQVFDVLYQGWAHDMFVETQPDGRVLMFVANWDAGLRVVDVSDPAAPKELGGWNAFPDGHEGNLHTVVSAWMGDRHITIGTVEVGFAVVGGYHYAMGTDASILYVWDTTDPTDIQLLGTWENPMGEKAKRDYVDGTVTSTHNFQLEDGKVWLAHYGLGVWVLDVSTPENWSTPKVVAYYGEDGMNVWDVVLAQGVMYATGAQGVLGLHLAGEPRGVDGITSRA